MQRSPPPGLHQAKSRFWGPRRLVAGTTLLDNDGRELFNLPLGSEESTEPLLGELLGLLVLGVPQQLHDSLLVRRESGNLSDDRPDKGLLLGLETLLVGRPGSLGDDGGGSALVHTVSEVRSLSGSRGHVDVGHC